MLMPSFSICHTTARPHGWQEACKAWIGAAESPVTLEYVLCVDDRWGFTELPGCPVDGFEGTWKTVWNRGRKCMVDGAAEAAASSTGYVLILNADDIFPPPRWDDDLLQVLAGRPREDKKKYEQFVIQVSSGTKADERGLMVMPILSRPRYLELGYALYPLYDGVFSDDDFSEHAQHDGIVLDAKHLVFPHRHPTFRQDRQGWDAVYQHQNAKEKYETGFAILTERRANQFRC
jgi:hypothetical protein